MLLFSGYKRTRTLADMLMKHSSRPGDVAILFHLIKPNKAPTGFWPTRALVLRAVPCPSLDETKFFRAGDGDRTHDINLGKLAYYRNTLAALSFYNYL